jgi:hypothetical protein
MLIPGFTVLISIKLIFAEQHYGPFFNIENHVHGGRYEGIKSENSFRPIGSVDFPAWVLLNFTVSWEQGGLTSNIECSLNWPRNIEIIGTTALTAFRKIWALLCGILKEGDVLSCAGSHNCIACSDTHYWSTALQVDV